MRGYFSYFADDDAGKLALFKEEDKEIWEIKRKDCPIFKLIDYIVMTITYEKSKRKIIEFEKNIIILIKHNNLTILSYNYNVYINK
ncbi:hypothetical protein AGMMS50284_5050 [Clostridia bacterium]|nr:hypothetical protein AGMMS50284_5050 [Clostridia bacterium]